MPVWGSSRFGDTLHNSTYVATLMSRITPKLDKVSKMEYKNEWRSVILILAPKTFLHASQTLCTDKLR